MIPPIDYTVGFDTEGRIKRLDFTHYTRCGLGKDLSLARGGIVRC